MRHWLTAVGSSKGTSLPKVGVVLAMSPCQWLKPQGEDQGCELPYWSKPSVDLHSKERHNNGQEPTEKQVATLENSRRRTMSSFVILALPAVVRITASQLYNARSCSCKLHVDVSELRFKHSLSTGQCRPRNSFTVQLHPAEIV